MKVRIFSRDLLRLIPYDAVHTEEWLPVKLHKACLASGVDESESVNTKTFHHPKASGNRAVGHHPHDHVHRFGHQ
jgi:hypothetical protein